MKDMNNSLKILEWAIKNKKSFIVNYGKGYFTNQDVKELAYWDEEKQLYESETGYWGFELLYEIARGEVENTSIEIGE